MFSQMLKKIRTDRKIKQGELSKETGISQRVISGLERGETQPTLKQIEILSDFFGVTTDLLIHGNSIELNNTEREIIKAVRSDAGLLSSLLNIIESKKHIQALAA